ncbi:MAG: hypothetical protein VCA36_05815 [Opitutales bacterium]
MKHMLLPLFAFIGLVATPVAQASWAYVPLELRIAGAAHVVVGKVDRLLDSVVVQGRTFAIGAIKVSKVLKGPAVKELKLAWPGPAPFALSTDIKFRVGQEGVWILRPFRDQKGVFAANYPSDYQALAKLPEVQEKFNALNAILWSKPVDGLQLGAIVEQRDARNRKITVKGQPVKALASATAYLLVRNNGKAPVQVVNFPQDKPFTLKLTGPDGQDLPLGQPGFGRGKLAKYHFLSVEPNGLRGVGYGTPLPFLTRPGKHVLELTYANKRLGAGLVDGAVWTGQLKTRATFIVK